eukprot:2618053-Rhodomonas_salina.3
MITHTSETTKKGSSGKHSYPSGSTGSFFSSLAGFGACVSVFDTAWFCRIHKATEGVTRSQEAGADSTTQAEQMATHALAHSRT